MTAPTAELCGHRWWRLTVPETGQQPSGPYSGVLGELGCDSEPLSTHRCAVRANHPTTVPCTCRCGATTTRPTEGESDDRPDEDHRQVHSL